MKRRVLAAALAAGMAAFAEPHVLSDGVLTFDVDEADYPEAAPYGYTASLSGVTSIVKKGTGAVNLGATGTANAFTGAITVEKGFLMGWKPRFGTPSAVTVKDGAAVVLTETSTYQSTATFAKTKFSIAGAGPDGKGAFQRPYARANGDYYCLQDLTLTADATLNVGSRWGMAGGMIDMGNHTLTLSSAKEDTAYASKQYSRIFDLSRNSDATHRTITVKDPGAIVVADNCRLNVEHTPARLIDAPGSNGTVSNMTVMLRNGTYLRLFQVVRGAFPCRVVAEGTSYLMVHNKDLPDADRTTQSWHEGPLEIDGTAVDLTFYANSAAASNASYLVSGPVTGKGILRNRYRGYTFLAGTNTSVFGSFVQTNLATFVLQDDVKVYITNAVGASTYAHVGGASSADPATMIVKDNAQLLNCTTNAVVGIGGVSTAHSSYYGILKVQDNAVVSNDVSIGGYGKGACYLTGGKLRLLPGRRMTSLMLGHYASSYGYLGIDGGVFEANNWFYVGTSAPGFIVQRGGRTAIGPSSCVVRLAGSGTASYAHYAQLGGTSRWTGGYPALNFRSYAPNGEHSTAVLTVDGADTVMDMTGSHVRISPGTNETKAVTALVNVNGGGTLKTDYMALALVANAANPAWNTFSGRVQAATRAYLNFNGGTLVTTRAGEFFSGGTDANHLLTRATVFEGGAVIDTAGKDVTWRQPLERPYGHGIKSVTLPDAARAAKAFIGPARCFVTSAGGGAAADALMDFDDTNRVAHGMIITSRGFGYEAAPAAKIHRADCSGTWDCTVETVDFDAADFAHGGLTKRGAGTLTITCTNTYGGATRLEGGTLAFTHAQGYPGGDLEIAADAVRGALAAPLLTAGTLAFGEGKGVRVTEADTLDDRTYGRAKTVAAFTTPLAAVPSLTLVASDGSVLSSGMWYLALGANGTELRLGAARGTVLILH